jgi:membrane associated rhomboid family serine protease
MTRISRCDNLVFMRLSGRKPTSYTRTWTQSQRVALIALLAANGAAFVAQLFLEAYQPGFVNEFLGLSGAGVQNAYAWQFFTAIFMQAGPWHLLGNMIVLYFLGRDVESIIGQRHFVFLYVYGAIAGELGHLFLMPSNTVLLAASGGVAAVTMAYATVLPELELVTFTLFVPLRLKAKYLAYGALLIGAVLVIIDRNGTVTHSAYLGGCGAGWLYAHLLGFGRPSFLQRALHQRKSAAERLRHMGADEFIALEVDPLLEKISREGMQSLTRAERRTLSLAREKLDEQQ